MKGSIFEIALELIKMAKTSVWYFFRNVSSISNSTQHFNEFLVSMARRRHRHKSLYSFFFALLCFQQSFVPSIGNIDIILSHLFWTKNQSSCDAKMDRLGWENLQYMKWKLCLCVSSCLHSAKVGFLVLSLQFLHIKLQEEPNMHFLCSSLYHSSFLFNKKVVRIGPCIRNFVIEGHDLSTSHLARNPRA